MGAQEQSQRVGPGWEPSSWGFFVLCFMCVASAHCLPPPHLFATPPSKFSVFLLFRYLLDASFIAGGVPEDACVDVCHLIPASTSSSARATERPTSLLLSYSHSWGSCQAAAHRAILEISQPEEMGISEGSLLPQRFDIITLWTSFLHCSPRQLCVPVSLGQQNIKKNSPTSN